MVSVVHMVKRLAEQIGYALDSHPNQCYFWAGVLASERL
jgi:hypothetical protein